MERQSAQRHTAQDTPEDGDAKLLVLSHDTAQGARRPCVPSVLLCACQAPRLKWRARIRLPFVPTVVALVHFHPCQFLVYCSCRAVHCPGSLFHSHAWLRSGVYTVAILEKRALERGAEPRRLALHAGLVHRGLNLTLGCLHGGKTPHPCWSVCVDLRGTEESHRCRLPFALDTHEQGFGLSRLEDGGANPDGRQIRGYQSFQQFPLGTPVRTVHCPLPSWCARFGGPCRALSVPRVLAVPSAAVEDLDSLERVFHAVLRLFLPKISRKNIRRTKTECFLVFRILFFSGFRLCRHCRCRRRFRCCCF